MVFLILLGGVILIEVAQGDGMDFLIVVTFLGLFAVAVTDFLNDKCPACHRRLGWATLGNPMFCPQCGVRLRE